MPLTPGTRLGRYEVVRLLGAGGMGEVYLASDTQLDRTVAIKVLPEHLAGNAELRQRFEREARAVSSLNHPHICTLYDVGHEGDVHYLVMEHLEGETLVQRLRKGALPTEEALSIAIQIADALDKAHRQGVVHRDLKPGNIMLTKSGAKLLDFGLAKQTADAGPSMSSAALTQTSPLTAEGTVVGTFQYMAPEQLEGKEADARTDLFAFGAVLYEMVTGKAALEGKSQASLIAAIMTVDPPPVSTLQPMTPPALDHVIRRCLAKEPQRRWQAASDVMHELTFIGEGGAATRGSPVSTPARSKHEWLAWSVAAVSLVAAVIAIVVQSPPDPSPVRRLTLRLSQGEGLVTGPGYFGALSPDGKYLVYRATSEGVPQLWLRPMDRFNATPIPGTEGAGTPFLSPEGQWIGFTSARDTEIKKVSIEGGAPVSLAKGPWSIAGATWTTEETIIFGDRNSGLWRISAEGGEAEPLTTPKEASEATGHVWPAVLPKGKGVLFAVATGERHANQLAVLSLESGQWRTLGSGTQPILSPTGHIVFARDETLWTAPFDSQRLAMLGTPMPILHGVMVNRGHGTAHYTMAGDGTIVYLTAAAARAGALEWVDREGGVSPLLSDGLYSNPRLSPDGTRLAYTYDTRDEGQNIWILDTSRGTRQRLSVEGELNGAPVWTPDGTRIAYSSFQSKKSHLFWKRVDGSGEAELLLTADGALTPNAFDPASRQLILTKRVGSRSDILTLPIDEDRTPIPIRATNANETHPSLSPDGRRMAYVSDESGRYEVYVQDFPGRGGKTLVSTNGGTEPAWSPDGTELLYRNGNRMMVSSMKSRSPGKPEVLFQGSFVASNPNWNSLRNYDISPDGRRFVMVRQTASSNQLNVILNFFGVIEDRVKAR